MLSKNIFAAALSAVLLSGFGIQSFAQDIIKTKSGKTIEAKILEVSDDAIRYKRFNNQEGPTVVMKLAKVASVTYQNGEVEEFESEEAEEVNKADEVKPRSARSRSVDRSYVVQKEEETVDETPASRGGIWNDLKKVGFGIWFDPAGFMQWGPMIGAHMRFGSRVLADVHFRMSSAGLAYNLVANSPDDLTGPAFGISAQRIFPAKIGYGHIGSMFDFGYTDASYGSEECVWYTFYVTGFGGFTFQFKSGFFIDLSVGAGTLYLGERSHRYDDDDPFYTYADSEIWFFGLLQAKLGYEF